MTNRKIGRPAKHFELGSTVGVRTVVAGPEKRKRDYYWQVRCVCGDTQWVTSARLLHTHACVSCTYRGGAKRHGETASSVVTPEYRAYTNMRERCFNPRHINYPNYGGRGITVCDAWSGPDGFPTFLAAVGRRPSPSHSMGRIDNDGAYEPGNVEWQTDKQQTRNRRSNVLITVDGVTKTATDWSHSLGLKRNVVAARIKLGWDPVAAATTPKHKRQTRS